MASETQHPSGRERVPVLRPASRVPAARARHALLATLAAIVVPVGLIALAGATTGIPEPRFLIAPMAAVVLSLAGVHLGTILWSRRPASEDISFRELVLWRFLRRRRAEKAILSSTRRLASVGIEERLTPEDRLRVLQRLTLAIEAKDRYTHGHSRRVESHVYRTALVLSLTNTEIEDLRLAASLHDVGKIEIPDRVLHKTKDLSPAEMELVRRHPAVGARLVARAVVPRVTAAVRSHHERWDGRGYPDRKSGYEIPLLARIIAVADAYDAMTSTRSYRHALSHRAAVAELERMSGKQFDPQIVAAFVRTLQRPVAALGALVILSLPLRAVRRAGTLAHNLGAEAIAGTIGAAGASALIGIAVVTGGVAGQQGVSEAASRDRVTEPAPAEEEPISVLPTTSPDEKAGRTGKDDGDREVETTRVLGAGISPVAGEAPSPGAPSSSSQPPQTSSSNPPSSPPTTGGEQPSSDGGKPEPPPEEESSEEPSGNKKKGHSPHGDPKPDKGQECEGKGKGKGPEKQCT